MRKGVKNFLHVVITLALVACGVAGFILLTASRPQLERTKPPAPKPVVQVIRIETGPLPVKIHGEGTVRPLREIQLVPQVGGKVIYVSPSLVDGGEFKKGDVLIRIDPQDYQLAVTLALARVKDSESKLKVAIEEAAAATEEWRLLNSDKSQPGQQPPALVAKEPQLAAARAKLAGDRADLQKARLNLERTEIRAPFDGRVSAENIDFGQYVRSVEKLATLFSTEAAEIVVPLEDENLFWIDVPGFTSDGGSGADVNVHTRFAGRDVQWQGRVVRAEGQLDERTRLVEIVVHVDDPYASRPPLAAGLFVAVEIVGQRLENAAIIPRSALRSEDVVWLVDETGRLVSRKVEVAQVTADSALVMAGLKSGELVVTSGLKAVTEGMQVRYKAVNKENPSPIKEKASPDKEKVAS